MKALLRKIRQILKDRRTRRFLTRFVSGVAAIVVFVTTYALVLPAITMESEATCGIEAHQHDDSCYSEKLICGQEESEGHHHTDDCYTVTKELECKLEEHKHSAENGCFDEEGNLVCKLEEHTHTDSCYKEHRELTCGLEESEGHHHTDSCYEKVLTCGKEVHTHSAACYKADLEIESAAVASTGMTSAAAVPDFSDNDYEAEDSKDDSIVSESLDEEDADDTITPENNSEDKTDADADIKDESADQNDTNVGSDNVDKDGKKDKDSSKEGEEAASSFSTGFAADEDTENGDAYIPEKDALDFNTVLNSRTGIYYHHVAEDEKIEDSSAITDWNKADKDTKLNPEDLIRIYLSYTLPKDTINATNDISRYRLPDTLHLTDEQIEAINNCENGISAQYIDYDSLEITDPERHAAYLGLESVEGRRLPGEELKEDSQEYISAVVRAEKIYDEDTGEYEGTYLIFTFSPYAVEKNAHAYDKKGQPTRAGEEVTGWLTLDFNMGQIDWAEDKTSEIVFAEEDKISTVLRQTDSADIETDEDAADGTTEEAAADISTVDTAAEAASADAAADTVATDNTAETAEEADTADTAASENDRKDQEADKEETTVVNYPAAVFDDSITVRSGRLDSDLADTDIPGKTKMTVHVEADEGTFPEGTKMVLSAVEDLDAVAEAVGTAVDSKTRGFQAVDITFYDKDPSAEDAKEIEPLKPIRVSIKSDEIRKAAEDSSTAPVVVHIEDNNKATEIENTASATDNAAIEIEKPASDQGNTNDAAIPSDDSSIAATSESTEDENTEAEGDAVTFEADSFSIYAVVYTVDFHWEVDGKMYEYSLSGGDSVSFRKLVEVLGIVDTTKSDSENGKISAADGESSTIDEFINDVEKVEFSDESLVKVAQITEGITAGALKEKLGIESKYSAELTDAQKEAMDGKVFYAPDWALVSLKAFTSEEFLTVTMKTGESFKIVVTDAQIKKDFITASGETYTITVTYGDEAGIPEGSDLEVKEILSSSDDYKSYLSGSAEKLGVEDSEVSFARFFDIEIVKDGEKIEPKTPVQVEIQYKDAVEIGLDQSLSIVHFADDGAEVITPSVSEDGRIITYQQDSFSVTGTIVNNPSNGKVYALIIKYNGNYYSVQNDGTLKKVDYSGDGTVETTGQLDNPQMWTYNNNNLYHNYVQVGFNNSESPSDFYRRYIDPSQTDGLMDEVKENTPDNGVASGTGNGPVITSNPRPLESQTKISYSYTNKSIKQQNGNYYIGVKQSGDTLSIVGQCDQSHAAEVLLAEVRTLATSDLHSHNEVNHIDISILGTADLDIPLAYGTYYANGKEIVVNKDNHVTLDLSQSVDIEMQDIKNGDVRAYIMENGVKTEYPDAFYITGYSKNKETDYSTDQVRIDGIFKVAVAPDHDCQGHYTHWGNTYCNNPISEAEWAYRKEHRVYYTVSVTKPVTFPLMYTDPDTGETVQLKDKDGNLLSRTVNVTLSASFDYWDLGNQCPPLQERFNAAGYIIENHQGRENWKKGEIPNHDMSGMDFVLGANTSVFSDNAAIEITKSLVNTEGDIITPDADKKYTFNVYQGTENADTFKNLDVNQYDTPANWDSYNKVHEKEVEVGSGGYGVTYDYDISAGSVYVEEDKNSVDKIIVDKNGNIWYYDSTYIETEYVWRKTGDDSKIHLSDTYSSDSTADLNSIPEIAGKYLADEWFTDKQEFKTQDAANEFRTELLTRIQNDNHYKSYYKNVQDVSAETKNGQTIYVVRYDTIEGFNGFLEFDVYNVYKPVKSFKVEVEKQWENDNPVDDAEINITLGRYKLVKDSSQVVGTGNLVIKDSYSGLGSGSNYRAVYTVTGDNYTNTFIGDGNDVTVENLSPGTYTVLKTVTQVDGYSVNATEAGPVTVTVPEDGTGTATLLESVFTRTGETSYHVWVHWADGDYNWINSYYPADSVLNFNLGVPSWMTENGTFSYSMDGGASFTNIGAGESISIPFTLNRDYDIQIRYTRISQDWGPTWGGWLNGPTITGADPITTRSAAPRRAAKTGTVNNDGSITLTQTEPTLPAAPAGYHYEVDTAYAQSPHTFKLANGSWTASASGLDIGDKNGEYVYYIASVTETGLPDETVATLVDEVSTNSSAKVLTISNNVPLIEEYGDVSFTKKENDAEGANLPGAIFTLYKNYSGGAVSNPLRSGGTNVIATSGENGKVEFTNIPAGVYYMKETTAPEGYKLSSTVYKVTIKNKEEEDENDPETLSKIETISDQPETVTVIINEPAEYGEVEFDKKNTEEELLPGATFTLYKDVSCSEAVKVNNEDVTASSGDSEENRGKVKFTAVRTIKGEEKIGIETGDYYMKETDAPNGYETSDQKYFVHIGTGENGDTSFIAKAEDNPSLGNQTLEQYYRSKKVDVVENEPVKIIIKKVDDNGKALAGAHFTLKRTGEGTSDYDGDGVTKPGTDETDNGTFEFTKLVDGAYTLSETPPSGYTGIDDISFTVNNGEISGIENTDQITWVGETVTLTVKNTPVENPGTITVQKQWLDFFGNVKQPDDISEITVTLKRYKDIPQTKYLHVVVEAVGNNGSARTETARIPITNNTATVSWYDVSQFYWSSGRISTPTSNDSNISITDRTTHYDGQNNRADDNPNAVWEISNLGSASQNIVEVTFSYSIRGGGIDTGWFYNTINGRTINVVQSGTAVQSGDGTPAEDEFSENLTLIKSAGWIVSKTVGGREGTDPLGYDYPATDANGNAYHYFIQEGTIPSGYAVSYSTNNEDGIQVGTLTAYNQKTSVDVNLIKVDKNNRSTKLNDAVFTLRQIDPTKTGNMDTRGLQDGKTDTQTTSGDDANKGKLTFAGLEVGIYEIKETAAPAGYILSGETVFYIKVTESGIQLLQKDETIAAENWRTISNTSMVSFQNDTATVNNTPGAALPNTGGSGTHLFTILGSILILGAGVLLWRRRRTI